VMAPTAIRQQQQRTNSWTTLGCSPSDSSNVPTVCRRAWKVTEATPHAQGRSGTRWRGGLEAPWAVQAYWETPTPGSGKDHRPPCTPLLTYPVTPKGCHHGWRQQHLASRCCRLWNTERKSLAGPAQRPADLKHALVQVDVLPTEGK